MRDKSAYLIVIAAFALMPTPALAYLDPGMASIALQAAIGAVAAGLFAVKMYWQKVKGFFGVGPKGGDSNIDEKK